MNLRQFSILFCVLFIPVFVLVSTFQHSVFAVGRQYQALPTTTSKNSSAATRRSGRFQFYPAAAGTQRSISVLSRFRQTKQRNRGRNICRISVLSMCGGCMISFGLYKKLFYKSKYNDPTIHKACI